MTGALEPSRFPSLRFRRRRAALDVTHELDVKELGCQLLLKPPPVLRGLRASGQGRGGAVGGSAASQAQGRKPLSTLSQYEGCYEHPNGASGKMPSGKFESVGEFICHCPILRMVTDLVNLLRVWQWRNEFPHALEFATGPFAAGATERPCIEEIPGSAL